MKSSQFLSLFLAGAVLCSASNLPTYATTQATTPSAIATTTEKTLQSKIITVYFDGKLVKMDDLKPYLDKNNSVFLPLKNVAAMTKATLTWNKSTGKATYKVGKNTLQLTATKDTLLVNGKSIKLKNQTVNSNGNAYVPMAFLSEQLGLKTGTKLGNNKNNKNVFSHVVSITSSTFRGADPLKSVSKNGSDSGMGEKSVVDKGFENAFMSPEDEDNAYKIYEKIPYAVMGTDKTQVRINGTAYMMSMVPSYADGFIPSITIEYVKEGLITIDFSSLPTKWDYFFEKTLTFLMGSDGTEIATRLNKDFWSTYDKTENIYYTSKLKGKYTVGKYTVNYDTPYVEITWKK